MNGSAAVPHTLLTPVVTLLLVAASVAALQGQSRNVTPPRPPNQSATARPGDWDDPRVLRLVQRAIARRAEQRGDGILRDYRATATGHIYFLYDLGRSTERHLVKADQLALDLYWRAPDVTRQVIVGRRDEKRLPTSIRYHLDHLTVVLDNLGDLIRLGEGSEVADAVHPAAREALGYYEYRLADSLALELPDREIRVYKVEVRPHDPDRPGVVGAMYLQRGSADIVRMELTFTAASYLDDTLDYFNLRLENGLWQDRYWLPYRQGIELRRGVGFVDFPAGGIIRAEFRIRDYQFNVGTPEAFFRGPRVAALPPAVRQEHRFEEGLYDALDPAVAAAPPSLEEIREEAEGIVTRSALQRADGLGLAVPGISSVLRFRRAEGLYIGPGLSREFPAGGRLQLLGGYAVGADIWQVDAALEVSLARRLDLTLRGYLNRVGEVASRDASSGIVATLAAVFDGDDYREPYRMDGGWVALQRSFQESRVRIEVAAEDWRPAELAADAVVDRDYRAVRELSRGEVAWLGLVFERPPVIAVESVGGVRWRLRVEGASRSVSGDFSYVQVGLGADGYWPRAVVGLGLQLAAAAGAVGGAEIPAQRLIPVGGRGTVRGYTFHGFVGNLHAGGNLELSRSIGSPLVSLSAFCDIGWSGIDGTGARAAIEVWNRSGEVVGSSRGPLVGVGAGAGVLYDILRLEVARGLVQDGIWEFVFRVRSEFWGWL